MRILFATLALALIPLAGFAAETTNPATALDDQTFVVVSQATNEIGNYNVALFKVERERIVLKDSVSIQVGDLNNQAVLKRLKTRAQAD